MAFPTTSVLDAFNRTNGDLGAGWTSPIYPGADDWSIVSNVAVPDSWVSPVFADDYWNAATFGPNSEAYADMPTLPQDYCQDWVSCRLASEGGSSLDGYQVQYLYIASGTDQIYILRLEGASNTQLGATISQDFSNGDSLGIEAIGSAITAYRKTGGTWASLGSRTDTTYTAAGHIGMGGDDSTSLLDNFGGGTVAAAGGQPPRSMHQFRLRRPA